MFRSYVGNGRFGRRSEGLELVPELGRGQPTSVRGDHRAVAKEHQRRDARDTELLGQLRLGVHIDTHETDVAQLFCKLAIDRREADAGAAPAGPEINDYG